MTLSKFRFSYCIFILIILYANNLLAQNRIEIKVNDYETHQKLIGVSATIKNLKLGTISDSNGIIYFKNIPDGEYELIFSLVGYEKKEKEISVNGDKVFYLEVELIDISSELQDVIVTTTRTNSRIEDIPIRVEVIGQSEINEEGNIKPANISKLLLESPSVQAQQTSATNGNVSIRLQGLDGKYTQILKDGFPLYGGFSQGLSIMQIPPLDLKQIEIIKGSASSLYGSDAIAGIINLVSKIPTEKREFNILLNQTSLYGNNADLYYSKKWKKFGFSLFSANSFQSAVDVNGDGFSDLPLSKTYNLSPSFYYKIDTSTNIFWSLNSVLDSRKGGLIRNINRGLDSSNSLLEENLTNRYSSQFKFEKKFNKNILTLKNSLTFFERNINQNTSQLGGKQIGSYSEISLLHQLNKHKIVLGANYISEKFEEDSIKSHQLRNYNYQTIGIFVQDDWRKNEQFSLQYGIRLDYQNKFGFFFLPKVAMIYKFNPLLYIRTGLGLGYKNPSIFSTASELAGINNIAALPNQIKTEQSISSNLDINYKLPIGDEASITFNQAFFVTQINQPLVLEANTFSNKEKPIITNGFESNIRYRLDEFQIFAAYTFVNAQRTYNISQPFMPLTPKHKVNFDIIFEEEKDYMFALEAFYISSMYRDNDFDTKDYFTFGLIYQKHFRNISIITSCENLFDIRQSKFENILMNASSKPYFRQLYAPIDGRVFSIGVKYKL